MDVLNIRADIHPGIDLHLVVRFDSRSISGTENRLRQRSKLIAGTHKVPANPELIATMLPERTGVGLPSLIEARANNPKP